MPEVLPDFALIALAFLAIAFALAARLLVKALFSPLIAVVGHIPGVGSALSGVLAAIERTLVGACGAIYNGGDKLLGWSFHQLASQANWLWREIRAHSLIVAEIAALVGALAHGYHWLRAEVRTLTHGSHSIGKRLGHFERKLHGIERGVRTFERDFGKVLHKDVLPEIRSLDKELNTAIGKTIPAIQKDIAAGTKALTDFESYVAKNYVSLAKTALVAAVAAALGYMGLGGLRCSTLGNMLGRRGCGLWSDLEGLLGLFADTLLLTNICTLLPILETAVSDVADPLVIALTDAGAGLCSGGIGAPPALTVPALSLPTSPGLTLSLP